MLVVVERARKRDADWESCCHCCFWWWWCWCCVVVLVVGGGVVGVVALAQAGASPRVINLIIDPGNCLIQSSSRLLFCGYRSWGLLCYHVFLVGGGAIGISRTGAVQVKVPVGELLIRLPRPGPAAARGQTLRPRGQNPELQLGLRIHPGLLRGTTGPHWA